MTDSQLSLDHLDIMKMLPHRYPFLLVDRIVRMVPFETIEAYKNVTINEPFFQGHFPGFPVMPGVLILEAMAQVGAVHIVKSQPGDMQDKLFLFAGVEKVRFKRQVFPGDRLDIRATYIRHKLNIWKTEAEALVDGKTVAKGVLTAAVVDRGETE